MEPAPLTGPPPPAAPDAPPMSLGARMFNLFVTPGEVFAAVKNSPSTMANWLVPAVLLAVIGVISACLVMSQPAMIQQIREQQQKMFDQQVAAGKMSQAQADRALEQAEKYSGPGVLKITGSVGAVIVGFASVFWWAFLMWLIARWFLGTKVEFLKMAEVSGLANMIAVLEIVLKTLLILILSNPSASISPALFLKDADPGLLMLVGVLNPMTFWVLAVRSIGLAKFAGVSWSRAAIGVFGGWIVLTAIFVGLAIAMQNAFGK